MLNYCNDTNFSFATTEIVDISTFKRIGSGGQATAYLDEKSNKVYKVFQSGNEKDAQKEFGILQILKDEEHVVNAHKFVKTEKGLLTIQLDHCPEGSLYDKTMDEKDLMNVYKQIGQQLLNLGPKCIAHVDVTMNNIVKCPYDKYKLIDFGAAKQSSALENYNSSDLWTLGRSLFEKCVGSEKFNDVYFDHLGKKIYPNSKPKFGRALPLGDYPMPGDDLREGANVPKMIES